MEDSDRQNGDRQQPDILDLGNLEDSDTPEDAYIFDHAHGHNTGSPENNRLRAQVTWRPAEKRPRTDYTDAAWKPKSRRW